MALGMAFQILALQAAVEEEEEEEEEPFPGDTVYSKLTDDKLTDELEGYDKATETILGMLQKPEIDLRRTSAKALKKTHPFISIYYDRFELFGDSIDSIEGT